MANSENFNGLLGEYFAEYLAQLREIHARNEAFIESVKKPLGERFTAEDRELLGAMKIKL